MTPELSVVEDTDLSYLEHHNSKYSKEQKIKAAATYLLSGNVYQTAMTCGLEVNTISDWKTRSVWWPKLIEDLRKEKQDQLDAVLTTTLDTLLTNVSQRLEEGDPYVKKDGTIGFMPVKAKDMAVMAAIFYDKRALIRGEATQIKRESNDSLKSLEEKFKAIAVSMKEKDIVSEQ